MEYNTYLTGREVCQWLKISRHTLWKLRKETNLPVLRVGGTMRYHRATIEAWLGNGTINEDVDTNQEGDTK